MKKNSSENFTGRNKKTKTKKLGNLNLRKIFLPLFTITIMTIIYFYSSEGLGSISTAFMIDPNYSLNFNFTMLIFVFLSFLAGSLQGGISGFLGEFLYQFVTYEFIRLEWCVVISMLGFISGIYKYKPGKYFMFRKVFYTLLILIGITIFSTFLIIIFNMFLNPSFTFIDALINLGMKFILQSLLSGIFLVPFLLWLYDKALANKESYIYNSALTHHPIYQSDHTFYLKFGKTFIFFCSRCSGIIIGGLIMSFVFDIRSKGLAFSITAELAVILCILLPIPGMIDWGTQTLGLRKSSTFSRLFTGFIIGSALYILTFTSKYYFFMIIIVIVYFIIVGILLFIGNRIKMKTEQENNTIHNFSEGNIIE
ncbi:MAG: conserved membrane protein of unknown function [Promethearchaeota archaeon]|nr:MAG: conserved membrane protein of unknown function [Candidatus Lokiarchaeota archaeon]